MPKTRVKYRMVWMWNLVHTLSEQTKKYQHRGRKKRSLFGYYGAIALRPTAWSKLLALGGFYFCTIFIVWLYSTFATTLPLISLSLSRRTPLFSLFSPAHSPHSPDAKRKNLQFMVMCLVCCILDVFFFHSYFPFTRRPGWEYERKKKFPIFSC